MSDSLRIDDHKLHLHPKEVARWLDANGDWEKIRKIYPVYVEISPFGGCNFRCSFCAVDFLKYKSNKIELPVLQGLLRNLKENGVKSVLFAGEGEPLLHDELGEALGFCSEIGLDAALVTNGSVPNRSALAAAAKFCKWVKISVNAGSAEAHAGIHSTRKESFERVFENARLSLSARQESGSNCTVGAQAVLIDDNRDTLVDLARKCRETGLDYLVIKPYSQHTASITRKHSATDYTDLKELADALAREQSESFKVHFRLGSFQKVATGQRNYTACYSTPVFWAYVRATGDVYGCLDFLHDPRFRYGNIHEAAFSEIWEGAARKASYEHVTTSHKLEGCRVNCRMNKVNEYLWELTHPSGHENFI